MLMVGCNEQTMLMLGDPRQDGMGQCVRFHQKYMNRMPFRTYDLFLFGIIYLIVLDHG